MTDEPSNLPPAIRDYLAATAASMAAMPAAVPEIRMPSRSSSDKVDDIIAKARLDASFKRVMGAPPFVGDPGEKAMKGVTVEAARLDGAIARSTGTTLVFDVPSIRTMDDGQVDEIVRHEMMHVLRLRRDVFNIAADAIVDSTLDRRKHA